MHGLTQEKPAPARPGLPPAVARVKMHQGGRRIFLQAHPALGPTCKAIPGHRWDPRENAAHYPASPHAALAIAEALRDHVVRGDAEFVALLNQAKQIKAASGLKTATDLPLPPFWNGPRHWRHQLQAYHFAYGMPGCLLAIQMAGGKTRVAVDLAINRGHKRVLVVCPLSVIQEWPGQFQKYAGKPVICAPLGDNCASVKDKVHHAKMAALAADKEGLPLVLITNYDSIWRDPMDDYLMKLGLDFVIGDELHRVQSPSAKCSRYLARLGEKVPHRLGLTGTPFSSGPLSVYGQYRFLDPGIFGTNFQTFRERFAKMGGYGNHQVVGYSNEEELREKFYSIAFRVLTRDVLDLPEEQHVRRAFRLSAEEMRNYKELERDLVLKLRQGEVTVNNALTKLLRLQQMTSGFVRLDATDAEEGQVVRVGNAKQKLLADVLSDLDQREPVVVFGRFKHDLDAIREVCQQQGRRYMEVSGRIKQTEEWRQGGADVLGVQIGAGSEGINLIRAHYCVYYSVGYSLYQWEQSIWRTMRPGQEHNVTYVSLVAEDTVDVKVHDALSAKSDVVRSILADLR